MLTTPAYAQAAAASPGMDLFGALLPIALIFLVFYFLIIRPQNKKMKEHRNMCDAVKRGDRILTAGGLLGNVTKVGEEEITVALATNVEVQVLKSTIANVLQKDASKKDNVTKLEPKKKSKTK